MAAELLSLFSVSELISLRRETKTLMKTFNRLKQSTRTTKITKMGKLTNELKSKRRRSMKRKKKRNSKELVIFVS